MRSNSSGLARSKSRRLWGQVLNLGILLFKKEVMIFRAGKLSSWQAHKLCVYGVRLLSLVWRKKELAIL
jgi:hypothetical protein